MSKIRRGFDIEAAAQHLGKRDRRLARWMTRLGPIDIAARWRKPFDTSDALARAILYQQLSGKAAATIVGRVEVAIAAKKLHGDTLGRIDDVAMRACGVSGNKILALRDLAARDSRGEIPTAREMAGMDDAAIIEHLTAVRGIGRWTVEMMLMFNLGRPDVLPIDDLGIRKGAMLLDKQEELPKPKALAERGEVWGPYRTLAALYLWRMVDPPEPDKPKVKRSQD